MCGNDNACERLRPPQNHVTFLLPLENEPGPFEGSAQVVAGKIGRKLH